MSVLENSLIESVPFSQKKICPFYVDHSFFMKHIWTYSFNTSLSFEGGIIVLRIEKSNALMVLYGERDLTCVYFPHIKLKTDNTAILLDKKLFWLLIHNSNDYCLLENSLYDNFI